MTPKLIALCIVLFLSSALITLTVRSTGHSGLWRTHGSERKHHAGKPESNIHGSKVAFATFLTATAGEDDIPDDQDGYFLGTRVIAYQLMHSKSAGTNLSIPFIVVCTKDVSARKRARLEKDGAKVVVVEPIKSDWTKPSSARWAELMTKLRVFEMTEYHKVCLMDSDMLITASLDGVFYDESTLNQPTLTNPREIKEDEADLPRTYMMAAHGDSWGYDHPYPPPADADYLNAGFLVFSPSKNLFNYYLSILQIPGRFDSGMMEQNLLNYAHRRAGNMPWKPLWYGWNMNWPTEKDWKGGARSFHAKYWDSDPSHDQVLKAIWKEQRAEMDGFYRGREMSDM